MWRVGCSRWNGRVMAATRETGADMVGTGRFSVCVKMSVMTLSRSCEEETSLRRRERYWSRSVASFVIERDLTTCMRKCSRTRRLPSNAAMPSAPTALLKAIRGAISSSSSTSTRSSIEWSAMLVIGVIISASRRIWSGCSIAMSNLRSLWAISAGSALSMSVAPLTNLDESSGPRYALLWWRMPKSSSL
jgi:hypothetical protein